MVCRRDEILEARARRDARRAARGARDEEDLVDVANNLDDGVEGSGTHQLREICGVGVGGG